MQSFRNFSMAHPYSLRRPRQNRLRERPSRESPANGMTSMRKRPQNSSTRTQHQLMMEWDRPYRQSGIGAGLENLGNSCFMNSTLQCLAYLPPLTQMLDSQVHSSQCKTNGFCLLCECERLLPAMTRGGGDTLYPASVFTNISTISPCMEAGDQQDAHEFLQTALAMMDEEDRRTHLIQRIFRGDTRTLTQCQRCMNTSCRDEPFLCLSVEMNDTLQEALTGLAKPEWMVGQDAYFCEFCQSKQDAVLARRILTFPPILAVHLKRFEVSFDRQGNVVMGKDDRPVAFSLEFETDPEISSDGARSARYELCGMIVHRGGTAQSGHYYAVVKGPNGRWYRMNDEDVSNERLLEVANEEGYVLFYKRKGIFGRNGEEKMVDAPNVCQYDFAFEESSDSDSDDERRGIGGTVDCNEFGFWQ